MPEKINSQLVEWSEFENLQSAYNYTNKMANDLIVSSKKVIANALWNDLFKEYRPKSRISQLLGVTMATGKKCQSLASGGKWWVNCKEIPGQHVQFSAWYSKYLPYAYAMMLSEEGFECFGIDYTSINCYFKTVGGFVALGTGDVERNVIDEEDIELYKKCYNASMDIQSPQLIFSEAFNPAICFVAIQRPDLFVKYIQSNKCSKETALNDWRTKHVLEVIQQIGLNPPQFKWKK